MATAKDLAVIREAAEADFPTFVALLAPQRVLGMVHIELLDWWEREDALTHQLVLLPRGHQKSWLIAMRVVWYLTRDPTLTFLYISATALLAQKQLGQIKDILTSKIYTRYWPTMVNPTEGKRKKWTEEEITVDHPLRKEAGLRDASILAAGMTKTVTGLHCDITVLDDVVVRENTYTTEGRQKVANQYSLLGSVENPDSTQWVVGTRYHPKDLYNSLQTMTKEHFRDEDGELIGEIEVYEVFQRQVEDQGNGYGEYLWPRQQRADGKWFGFNHATLAQTKAKYLDKTQFRAQYYNDPHDSENAVIKPETFQYYDRKHVNIIDGQWYFKDQKLKTYAAIDFAFSMARRADYTAVIVVGIDVDSNIFVLYIDRFKTDRISRYFESIRDAWFKWGFKTLRAEVTVAQQSIVRELKDNYFPQHGILIKIDEYRPSKQEGNKEERITAVLQPRYDGLMMYHYKGGNCELLEEELRVSNPSHDDLKDALAAAVDVAVPPARSRGWVHRADEDTIANRFNKRFGGVRH